MVQPDHIALFLCLCFLGAWINILIYKFNQFGYYDWDLAIYTNAMWGLTHGTFNGSLWGTNFLTNHAEYISLLIVPIYWLFPSAITLLALKLISLIIGGFVLYLIAKEKIGWILSLAFMLLYLVFPANIFMLIFEFHFESLAICFLFLVYYFLYIRKSYINFIICCLLASLCKENIPPVIFMFGLMALFQKKLADQRFAWTAMGISAGVFILGMFIITPILRHEEGMTSAANPYIGLYWYGQEKLSFFQNLIHNLHQYRLRVFHPITATYIKDLFYPLLFLPFLGFTTFAVCLPILLQNVLSINPAMHGIYHHYAATLVPILFLATLEVMAWAKSRYGKRAVSILTLLLMLSLSYNWIYHLPHLKDQFSFEPQNDIASEWTFIKQIPPQAGVTSTFEYLSVLANRNNVYPLRNIWNNSNIFNTSATFIPPQTQFALINWNDSWLWGEVMTKNKKLTKERLNNLKDFYFKNNWHVKGVSGEITLLEQMPNNYHPQLTLVEVQKNPFADPGHSTLANINIDNKFQLLYSNFSENIFTNFTNPSTAITFYWKAKTEIDDLYNVKIRILRDTKFFKDLHHTLGYAIYPTPIWENGDYIKETFWIDHSSLSNGKYTFFISIGDDSTGKWVNLEYHSKQVSALPIGTMIIQPSKGDFTHEK